MGYLHIDNLYKEQKILLFKECYAMEKIHGTSAHIKWNTVEKKLTFFSGESQDKFVTLFDQEFLRSKFEETFNRDLDNTDVTIFGEAYGGKCQGMSDTYGKQFKFIAFDVQVGLSWLNVQNAEQVCKSFNIEFVHYVKIPTALESIDAERDSPSVQAVRNGCGADKLREGIVLRPLIELRDNAGKRIISKHKREEFSETKTKRDVDPERLKVLEDAKLIAEEWVTPMRLNHVLDKLPQGISIESTKLVINAMVEDVYREAKGEIVENNDVKKAIANRTAFIFKQHLNNLLKENNQ